MSKENIVDYLQNYNGEKIVMFGASQNPILLMQQFEIENIMCFCDNDPQKHGKRFNETYDIISVDELLEIKEPVYVIISSDYFSDIYKQLKSANFAGNMDSAQFIRDRRLAKEQGGSNIDGVAALLFDSTSKTVYSEVVKRRMWLDKFIDFSDIRTDEELYFNKSIFDFSENEAYVDAGAIGGSSFDFIKAVNGKFDKIYCFEPGIKGYEELCAEYERRNIPKDKYEIFKAGIFSETKMAHFSVVYEGSHSNFVTETNRLSVAEGSFSEVQLYKLDDIIDGKITLIKMDVEGSELAALKGAERIIQEHKPKLAICLYHKITDFWEIPIEIHRICPEYKLYIRHHSHGLWDTVLYACV